MPLSCEEDRQDPERSKQRGYVRENITKNLPTLPASEVFGVCFRYVAWCE